MSKTQETLQEMAKLTMLTNKLNDVQIKNLKMFPYVFFEGLQEVTIDYDLSNNIDVMTEEDKAGVEVKYDITADVKHMRVSYYLTLEPAIQQTHMPKRFEALEGSIRNVFWKEVKVEVFINGIRMFVSSNEPK